MYSQSTYKELLSCSSGVLSAHQQKDSWFGGWWWVFHCFQKTENYPHAHFRRHETVSRPQQSHCKGHCPRPDTRPQGLPTRGHFHTVAPGRADEREGGQCEGSSSLTSYPTKRAGRGPAHSETGAWTPSPGSSPFPTLLPGKASFLFSKSLLARESQRLSPWTTGLLRHVTVNHSLSLDVLTCAGRGDQATSSKDAGQE